MGKTGNNGWIGVDLDGTLAHYDEWRGVDHVGEPVPLMVARVKKWLKRGETVKIFTARMSGHGLPVLQPGGGSLPADCLTPVEAWCLKHLGQKLPVTNVKDFGMVELWDDRAVQVVKNAGRVATATGKAAEEISQLRHALAWAVEVMDANLTVADEPRMKHARRLLVAGLS